MRFSVSLFFLKAYVAGLGFADMLNEMRLGKLSSQSIETFKTLSRPIHYDDELDATEL